MRDITVPWLQEHDACRGGLDWFVRQGDTNAEKVLLKLVAELHYDWANWVITKLLPRPQRIKYAVFAAEQALTIYEAHGNSTDAPREAIEAAKSPHGKDLLCIANAAENSPRIMYRSTFQVAAAARAASYAAHTAKDPDKYADHSAIRAETAAFYAFHAGVDMEKIITYGIKLLKGDTCKS